MGGNMIKRQNLTQRQYLRANRVMCMILLVSYLVYIVVEVINAKSALGMDAGIRCGVYGAAAALSILVCIAMPRKKATAIIMATMYLVAFPVLIFGNGIVVLAMVFPVLIGFMIYLNSLLVGLGWASAIIIGAIKCMLVRDDPVLFNYGIMIMAGYVVAAVGGMSVILLLIKFSKEDRAAIEAAAEQRAKVAATVAGIVADLYGDFTDMVHRLETIQEAMHAADDAMDGIAASSTETANAINNQARMTSNIQGNIEHTHALAENAGGTTQQLDAVISRGRDVADQLLAQSNIVDRDVESISDVMQRLMENVQRVTGITHTIHNISSQTNLLALNASVEAARAGAAGRGFSVIAGQIRSMATETDTSTKQISRIIQELMALTKEIQSAIQEAAENISQQRRQVDAVSEGFGQIHKGMAALQRDIGAMGDNVTAVLHANGEIVESIGYLSAASEEVSTGTQVCKQTTDTAFENLKRFSKKVEGAFEQLQRLKETAGA